MFPGKILFLFVLMMMPSITVAASFDCQKAKSPIEKLICTDSETSKLDEDLNKAYRHALMASQNKTLITRWQREWLNSADLVSCKNITCLKEAFSVRINVLNNVIAPTSATGSWNGKYVRYWKGKEDRDAASLLLVGLKDDRIYVSGFAVWVGPRAKEGQVNTGEMEGVGTLRSNMLHFEVDECKAKITRNLDHLIVEEESGCGGLHVSFIGEYKKK